MASIRKRVWKTNGVEKTAWVVDYTDQAGKRRLKTFSTKREADSWAVLARHEVAQGTHTPASISGKREIPLVPMAINALKQWQPHCPAGELGLVFPNNTGRVDSLPNI